jgi:hypothetical protein
MSHVCKIGYAFQGIIIKKEISPAKVIMNQPPLKTSILRFLVSVKRKSGAANGAYIIRERIVISFKVFF